VPLDKQTLDERCAALLRDRIVSGALAPGARIVEIPLAAELGISRGTLRAALQRLVHERLAVRAAYSGWAVSAMSPQDAWELFSLRGALEGLAAGLVAGKAAEPDLEPLRSAFAELERSCRGRGRPVSSADVAFHRTLVGLARHERLAEQYSLLAAQIERYVAASDALIGNAAVLAQHEPILRAVLAGDAQEAEALSRRHAQESGDELLTRLHFESRRTA